MVNSLVLVIVVQTILTMNMSNETPNFSDGKFYSFFHHNIFVCPLCALIYTIVHKTEKLTHKDLRTVTKNEALGLPLLLSLGVFFKASDCTRFFKAFLQPYHTVIAEQFFNYKLLIIIY
jgi:hypothetical protein